MLHKLAPTVRIHLPRPAVHIHIHAYNVQCTVHPHDFSPPVDHDMESLVAGHARGVIPGEMIRLSAPVGTFPRVSVITYSHV